MAKREEYVLKAERRTALGSRASRRLRARGHIPANLYGHGQKNVALSVEDRDFSRLFRAGHRMVTLQFDGAREVGLITEVQYDPVTDHVVHVDFTRVYLEEVVEVEVPITTRGVPKGVQGGGILEHVLKEIKVRGPARDIPEELVLQIAELEVGATVRVRELALPESCGFVGEDPEDVVLHILVPKGEVTPEEVPEEEAEAAEPEVVKKKRKEEAEDGEPGGKGS